MPVVRRALTVAICVVALAGCTADDDDRPEGDAPVVQLGGPSESNRTLSDDEAADITSPSHTEADVSFVQGMIAHHQQALEMTAMVEQRTQSRDIRALSERMDIGQTDEIAQMETWLTDRGEDVPGEHAHHGAGHDEAMPGMLTPAQLADLAKARGEAFDELLLRSMIYHHEGAVLMVEQLLADEQGGQEPQVFQLAQHMDSDQRVEIERMKTMLAAQG